MHEQYTRHRLKTYINTYKYFKEYMHHDISELFSLLGEKAPNY